MIELLWNNPISEAKMAKYLGALQLAPGSQVLDVGCGCGEVLLRIHEQCSVRCLGIDQSPDHIQEAHRRTKARLGKPSSDDIKFVQADATSHELTAGAFQSVVCIGSTHAFGLGSDAYVNALAKIHSLLAPGGVAFIGEGYMRQPASAEYRKFLGDDMPDHMTHENNVATAKGLGFIPVAAWTSSIDEWDDFEWGYQRIIEDKARAGDETAMKRLAPRREWMDAYLKWGRDTLGFAVYLLRKDTAFA